MASNRWDEILVSEHEMIERAMDVLKRELDGIAENRLDVFTLKRAIDFLLEFGDRIHNAKEENWLFPLMVEKGIPQDGPIRVMLSEHEYERTLLDRMSKEVDLMDSLSAEKKTALKENGLEYLEVRANHIWKENDVLYALGRKVFSDGDNENLVKEFGAFSASVYGEDFEEKFLAMLDEVEKGEAARKCLVRNLSYEQIDAIMETLPVEVTFVDADDTVAYFNRLDKDKIFVRSRSVIGRKVAKCHPKHSVEKVVQIVERFKSGELDKAEFWINLGDQKVFIRYFPVRNEQGKYLGVLEVTQEVAGIQKLSGEKRLL